MTKISDCPGHSDHYLISNLMKRLILLLITSFLFSLVHAQTNKTILVMEKRPGLSNQTWFYSGSGNPPQQDLIKKYWDKDQYITSAAYTENGWFIVMSTCPDYTTQSYKIDTDWPAKWIKEKYDQDYYITSISKSERDWFVVMSKVKSYTAQSYNSGSSSELSDWYDEKRNKGYHLTSALYGKGKWYWVMTKGTNIKSQGYKWATDANIRNVIREIWDSNSRIHLIEYGNGSYFIPFGDYNYDSQPAQTYKTSQSGVKEWISEEWKDNLNITYIGGGNPGSSNYASSNNSSSTTQPRNGNEVVRTYRENRGQNYYNEVTEYANGSKIVSSYGPCTLCGGSQLCNICYGSGGMVTAGYGTWIPCSVCGQTGRCSLCRKTGGYVLTGIHSYDANGKEIYISPVGGGGSSSISSGNNSSGVCSSCGGTGVSKTPNSGGSKASWVAYYNSAGSTCPYCSRVDQHYHDRCSRCNIPRN